MALLRTTAHLASTQSRDRDGRKLLARIAARPRWTSVLWDIENVPVPCRPVSLCCCASAGGVACRERVVGRRRARSYILLLQSVSLSAKYAPPQGTTRRGRRRADPRRREERGRRSQNCRAPHGGRRGAARLGRDLCHRVERHGLLRGCEAAAAARPPCPHPARRAGRFDPRGDAAACGGGIRMAICDWRQRRCACRRAGNSHIRGGGADRAQEATSEAAALARGARRGRRRRWRRRLASRE